MSNTFRAEDNIGAQPVILAPVHSSYFNQISTEPQMVIKRAANSAYLYFSSNDIANKTIDPSRAYIRAEGDQTLMTRVKRMGLSYLQYIDSTPIINETNSVFQIWCGLDNNVYTLNVAYGNWDTPQKIMKAFANAIVAAAMPNAVDIKIYFAGNVGMANYVTPQTDTECVIVFPYNVYFIPTTTGMRHVRSTYAFPVVVLPDGENGALATPWNGINPVNQTSNVIKFPASGITPPVYYTLTELYTLLSYSVIKTGYMPCRRTRFIDFFTPTINNFTKLPNASSRSPGAGLLYRLFLDEFTGYDSEVPIGGIIVNTIVPPAGTPDTPILYQKRTVRFDSNIANPVTFCRNVDESINNILFDIFDEYGNFLTGTPSEVFKFANPAAPSLPTLEKNQVAESNFGITYNGAFYCEI